MRRCYPTLGAAVLALLILPPMGLGGSSLAAQEPLKKHVQPVQWPAKSTIDLETREELQAQAREQIPKSPVPVLLPRLRDLPSRFTVLVGPNWFAASASEAEYSIAINASRISYKLDSELTPELAVEPQSRVRGLPAWGSASEGIWSLAWEEFGVSYLVRVGCAEENSQCDGERYVREIADSLVFVGGAQ